MSTDTTEKEYDQGASNYDDIISSGVHHEVEYFSFFKVLGKVEGKTVLDVACGSGRYTRLIRDRKPAGLVGVDLSGEMIKIAEETDSKGITYLKHDLTMPLPKEIPPQYDIVTSQYLLCYASTKDMLREMVRNCFNACKPGAAFINLTDNPFLAPSRYEVSKPYGYTKKRPAKTKDGKENTEEDGFLLEWHFFHPKEFVSEVWVWKPETYEAIVREAGFVDFEWWGFSVPTQFLGDDKMLTYLADAVMTPAICGFSARRPE